PEVAPRTIGASSLVPGVRTSCPIRLPEYCLGTAVSTNRTFQLTCVAGTLRTHHPALDALSNLRSSVSVMGIQSSSDDRKHYQETERSCSAAEYRPPTTTRPREQTDSENSREYGAPYGECVGFPGNGHSRPGNTTARHLDHRAAC